MALSRVDKDALLKKMRENKNKKGGFRDPTEWRPKFDKDRDLTYRIAILPPLQEGDACLGKDGSTKCNESWNLYYYQRGGHFINNKFHECPRVRLGGGDCPVCTIGFDLMRESDDKEVRKQIAKEWLSQESHVVNIYFFDHKDNPDDLRGKVMWWKLPMAIFRQCEEALDRDDDGGDEDDPKPFGLFFDPEDSFPVKVELREKAGYNNYDDSKMLSKARPIADSESEIEEILGRRVDVPSKFPEPDMEALNKVVDVKLSNGAGGSDSGFDDDDTKGKSKGEAKSEPAKSEPVKSEPAKSEPVKSESKDADEEAAKAAKAAKKKEEIEKARKAKEKAEKARSDDDDDDKPSSDGKTEDDEDDGELDDEMQKLLAQLDN